MEQTPIKVLLIDDSDVTASICSALADTNHSVVPVTGLSAALDYLRGQPADVVCLNLALSEANTEEFFNRIGSVTPTAALVAIAPDDETGMSQAIQTGAQEYLLPDDLNTHTLSRVLRSAVRLKQVNQTLQQTESRLRIIFESVQDYAIFSTDVDGFIDSWNIGAERQFGYTEAEILGTRTDILFTPEDREAGVPQLELATAAEMGSASDDRWHLRKDGSTFYASGMVRPLYNPQNQLIGFTKVSRDITEQQKAQETRDVLFQREQEARAQAERANKLKEVFVGMISHELRTPLTSIIGFATTLTAEDVTWSLEDVREFINIIHSEAQRMNELIEQLLDVSQQQSGTLRVRPEKRLFQYIMGIAMPQLVTLTQAHQLTLRIPDELPPLMADPQRTAQVLVNLIGNAVKYSPAGSMIVLSAHEQDGFVRFDVADQGVGIPAEQQDRIFDPFHQAASGSTSSRKGIGLGLTICRGIVEAHGGKIWLDSAPGRGTTFYFTLPVA